MLITVRTVGILIREMTIEGYGQAYELWVDIKGFEIRSADGSREGVKRFLKRDPTASVVAVQNGLIIGNIFCGHDGKTGYFYRVCVAPECKKYGTEYRMVRTTMKTPQREGVSKISLVVFKNNKVGNAFRQGIGQTEGEDVNSYGFILNEENIARFVCRHGCDRGYQRYWKSLHKRNKRRSQAMSRNVDGIRKIVGGVTAVKGFKVASTAAGVKYRDKKDTALIHSEAPCKSAGIFTSNIVKAAPVKWDKNQVIGNVPTRTVVISAGIANVCTGEEDVGYCSQAADAAAAVLGIPAENVLVAFTGVIGKQLPMDRIKAGIETMAPLLDDGMDNGMEVSRVIMTTDTKNKEVAIQFELGGVTVTMGGMCKGLGMVHPNTCTMLSFVIMDAVISKETLQEVLSEDIKDTYNMIPVDGDTPTNDTVLPLANGLAGNEEIRKKSSNYQVFCKALNYINETLAKKMAGDGEGCTALFEATIMGAKTKDQAKVLVRSVITSSLTKAAAFGHDTDWGRVLCAMGHPGASFDLEKVDLFFKNVVGEMQIIKDGVAVDYSEKQVAKILSQPQVIAVADIKMGDAQAAAWGCDLILDYVKINADYRS